MRRQHRFCVASLVLLLFAFHRTQASKQPLVAPLKIDTTKSAADSTNTCDRIRAGQTQILAIGQMVNTFVIVTTDLFIYELPHNAVTSVVKPHQVLVNKEPKHMRDRFNGSYSALERITNSILYATLMSIKVSIPKYGIYHVAEYIVFVYANRTTTCMLSIDVLQDKAISGPCTDDRSTGGSLNVFQIISVPTNLAFMGHWLKRDELPLVMCLTTMTMLNTSKVVNTAKDISPCFKMEDCKQAFFMPPVDRHGYINYSLPQCFLVPSEGIVSGFFSSDNKLHLISRNPMVFTMENLMNQAFVQAPLSDFIGCNVKIPNSVQLSKAKIATIVIIFVIVQLAIAVIIYLAVQGTDDAPDKKKAAKSKQKSQKDRKSKKSDKLSISSKSRRSISAVEGSKSSKSRKSRTSASRSVARDSASPLGCHSTSKRCGSKLSRSSKSPLSRGSSKKNMASKSTKSVAPAMSRGASVSKRPDSKSTASKAAP